MCSSARCTSFNKCCEECEKPRHDEDCLSVLCTLSATFSLCHSDAEEATRRVKDTHDRPQSL